MALRLNDTTAIIHRLNNLTQGNSDVCRGLWINITETLVTPAYVAPVAITNGLYTAYEGIYGYDSFGAENQFNVSANNGGGDNATLLEQVIPGTLIHVAYRKEGNNHYFYLNGILIGSAVENMDAVTFTEILLGNDRFSAVGSPITIFDYFEYNTAKSQNLIAFQMGIIGRPVNTENLIAFTPLIDSLEDISGSNNPWIGTGNFDFVPNPVPPTPGAGQIFQFDALNLDPDAFSLQNAQSVQYSDVPVGSGYSIIEQIPIGWGTPTYQVSNGSPNTNISVADGETVIVVVTNSLAAIPSNVMSGIYKLVPGKRNDTLWLEDFMGTRDVKIP